ncbi:MAG: DUF1015 domain-containing protein [Candidatus Marinimicrobia bacterium]|nr:DUF1015 domain-containing protein [Candidatus Neomarinimicrobiota bacterium]MCF7850173.1 DUF1015 domain-containing protein [Candidatus Neomarinimicrobiota bacterium]MCF7905465.1 DUF1015 domain-containing protein [Candidatus Neomarinimicrobiota bacterium]
MSILPFCGTIYNPDKFTNLSDIIAPPYDVITPEERRFLLSRSKYNSARLILGEKKTGDYFEDEFYSGAKELIKSWHEEGILCKREQPGLYFLHQFFTGPDGEQHIRKGFIALMPIEPLGADTVRAHERTHNGPIKDRLRLTATTEVNFSQIFLTYQDKENKIIHLLDEAVPKAIKKLTGKNEDTGVENICYLIEDEDVITQVQDLMEDKPVFIADGHHRYETLTQYRDQRLKETGFTEIDANYIMAYFACAQDTGLKVYPTHRSLRGLPDFSYQILLDKLMKYFTIEKIDAEDIELGSDHRIMVMSNEDGDPILLRLKDEAFNELRHRLKDPILAEMDTVILEEIVLKEILKLTDDDIQHHRYIEYHRDLDEFWEALRAGSQVGWIMNYPDNNILFEIGGRGLKLPQKSTFFFPKLPTGMVFRELED